jgi:hypothetical protein
MVVVRLDLAELSLNSRVIRRETADLGESARGIVVAVFLDEESRCFGEDEHATEEDEGVGELNGDGDTV